MSDIIRQGLEELRLHIDKAVKNQLQMADEIVALRTQLAEATRKLEKASTYIEAGKAVMGMATKAHLDGRSGFWITLTKAIEQGNGGDDE